MHARLLFFKDQQYVIGAEDTIKVVDQDNTGVVQRNMNFRHGLQQFLQIKEGLQVHAESLPGPSRSYIDVLGKYEHM